MGKTDVTKATLGEAPRTTAVMDFSPDVRFVSSSSTDTAIDADADINDDDDDDDEEWETRGELSRPNAGMDGTGTKACVVVHDANTKVDTSRGYCNIPKTIVDTLHRWSVRLLVGCRWILRERERERFSFSHSAFLACWFSPFSFRFVLLVVVIESGRCGVRPDEANEADRQTDNRVCKKCTRARQTGKKCRRQNPNTGTHNEATQRREPTGARNSKITSQRQWHRDNHHHHRRQRKSLHQRRQERPAQPHQPHQ